MGLCSVVSLIPLLWRRLRQVEAVLCINTLILNEENPVWEEHTLTM